MSALSFREQAAIAANVASAGDGTWLTLNPDESVVVAQELADACCKKWGHVNGDGIAITPIHGCPCARCGWQP